MKDAYDLAHEVHLAPTFGGTERSYSNTSFDFSEAHILHLVQEIRVNTNMGGLRGPGKISVEEEVCQAPWRVR
jgi:hypothetical protein